MQYENEKSLEILVNNNIGSIGSVDSDPGTIM